LSSQTHPNVAVERFRSA